MLRYAVARYNQQQRDMACRFYYAECLRILTENIASITNGAYIKPNLKQWLDGDIKEDTRSADEIALDILSKLKGGE